MDPITEAIAGLEPSNPEHWTNEGKPDTYALGHRLGRRVSAEERDAAWAEFHALRARQTEPASDPAPGKVNRRMRYVLHNGVPVITYE